MGEFFARPAVRAVVIVLGAAAVLGAGAAVIFTRQSQEQRSPVLPASRPDGSAFGAVFLHFFLGRTPDGSRPKANSQILRADTFLAGERVGLRVQTVAEQRSRISVELRFLARATREESAALARARQRFSIRPGLRTYCCVRMPIDGGSYDLGVLVEDRYVAFLPVTIKARPQQGGGLGL